MYAIKNQHRVKLYCSECGGQNLFIFLISVLSFLVSIYILYIRKYDTNFNSISVNKQNISKAILNINNNHNFKNLSCNVFDCFNVYRCGNKGNQLLVYVFPQKDDENFIKLLKNDYLITEFHAILLAIMRSKYYTQNPKEACIFVPSLDNVNVYRKYLYISHTLNVLQFAGNCMNYLIFNLILNNINIYNDIDNRASQAMIAGIGSTKQNYRKNFDISLPIFTTKLNDLRFNTSSTRKWFMTSMQMYIHNDFEKDLSELKKLFENEVQIFHPCLQINETKHTVYCIKRHSYKHLKILQVSTFCLILRGEKAGLSILLEALAAGCIPVIAFDSIIMPFEEVIDWSRAAVFLREADIRNSVTHLKKYSVHRIIELRDHGLWLYEKYFKSIQKITETTLDIIANRIFPHSAHTYSFWNEPKFMEIVSPIFLPLTIPKNDGFTAVILTYDRIDLLFSLIQKLSNVPSLNKILIIWNNEYKRPPRFSKWPKIHKVMRIIQTEKNVLSNRFYPFKEIETEAVLSIDDDIIMLTEDEIEFAYEVWREFPDRLVGFPSRTHTWDNKTFCWKYESEWTNRISMVLTGAAFYHKYWNYAYTVKLPSEIKKWIDNHMNCEDIAMNFLVSNITRKAPIKVTAKKKFRCPECVNTEMLSTDLTHMVERTQCINQFTRIFGHMPLMSAEFRADPVLFKDNFPNKLKRFNNVGSL